MDTFPPHDIAYIIRLDEILWGALLLALTLAIHGFGMFLTLDISNALNDRFEQARSQRPVVGLGIVILASWMIILVDLIEVGVWAGFFVWKGAQPNPFSAFYNGLLNYTTLAAGYLPQRWRLLEGMLGTAGLLTFAWSTGVLFSLAQNYQEKALQLRKLRRDKQQSSPAHAEPHRSGDSGQA
jgi:hypothetical protein